MVYVVAMARFAPSDLRALLERLESAGELVAVRCEVDPCLEVAEIHRRVIAAGGPALLFEQVRGSPLRLVTNLFGTGGRTRMAFGEAPFELIAEAVETLQGSLPTRLADLWRRRRLLAAGLRVGRRRALRAPVAEVVRRSPDLAELPATVSWSEDGGPFLTLPLVYTEPPGGGTHNLGIYRMQLHDGVTTGMHWQIGKGGGFHHARAEAAGLDLPVTVALGGPPAAILAAIAPLPENVPELLLASLLTGRRLRTVRGRAGHPVLADAEVVLSGRIPAGERRPEGPFGDHYGYYSLRHDYPVFRVEEMLRRRDAIVPATVVGKPRQEDYFIGEALQELLSPLFPLAMPAVRDLWSYGETGFHSLAAAVVEERYRREALVSAFRILGEGQLALTKFLLVTDRPVELRNIRSTLPHVLARTRPETDLYVLANLSMDTLDYTGPEVNLGSKGVWLGLGDPVRDLPSELTSAELPAGITEAHPFCPGCLVVGGPCFDDEPGAPSRIAAHHAFADWPLVILAERPAEVAADSTRFLWTVFTRFEPAADIHSRDIQVVRHHLSYAPPIVVDARMKPGYPAELECDPATAALVTRRWSEYFPDGGVEMG